MDWMQFARWCRSLPACSDRQACSAVSTPTSRVNRPPPWWSRAVPSPPCGIIAISPDDPASLPRSGAHDWQDGGVTFRVFDCTSDDPEQRAIAVDEARASVERGECIVLPTDTVYGIGADAFDSNAVQRLLNAKGRGRDMPPPVLIGESSLIRALAGAADRHLSDAAKPADGSRRYGGDDCAAGAGPRARSRDSASYRSAGGEQCQSQWPAGRGHLSAGGRATRRVGRHLYRWWTLGRCGIGAVDDRRFHPARMRRDPPPRSAEP